MSKRCRQCGCRLDDNEGDFCSSGCRHAFERENPGQLKKENRIGCIMAVIGLVLLLLYLAAGGRLS